MNATGPGTKAYFTRHTNMPSTILGTTGLSVSSVGFGGYRISEFEPEHREALKQALLSGVNLIDTSTNYSDGSSERLIGDVVAGLLTDGSLKREELVMISKVGYVQGVNLREAKERAQQGHPYPDMVEYHPDCWHNISPEFLQDQISKSLLRLKLDRLDVLLLHNPEYFLKLTHNRERYYQRIQKAFEYLEAEVTNKRIQYYGISSNTFIEHEAASEFTSLERVCEIAKNMRKNNHFAVVQFPLNLFEAGGVLNKSNARLSALQYAHKNQLGVLINRPLNAFFRNRLARLASFPEHDVVEIKGQMHISLGRAIELENKFSQPIATGLNWAHILRDKIGHLDDVLQWQDALYSQILPSLRKGIASIDSQPATTVQEYRERMTEVLQLITQDLESLQARKSHILAEQLTAVAPDLSHSKTLSQKALQVYRSLPGVNTILVGMRKPDYVRDALTLSEPLTENDAMAVLRTLQKYR